MELADFYFEPEKLRTELLIDLESSSLPEIKNNSLWLHEDFKINISDKNKVVSGITINHLHLVQIEYDFNKAQLIFVINEGVKIFGHRIILNRQNVDMRQDIIFGINFLSLIKFGDNILEIIEIKTSP